MGAIWPQPTEEYKKFGWQINPEFLVKVRDRASHINLQYGNASLREIETYLIAASLVEVNE